MVWPLQTMFTQMLRDSDSTKQIFYGYVLHFLTTRAFYELHALHI